MRRNRRKAGTAVAAATVFILLAIFYDTAPMKVFDRMLSDWLSGASFLQGFSFWGNPSTIAVVCLFAVVLLLLRGSPRDALFIVLAVGVGYAVNEGLKMAFGRPRPEMPGQLESYSFPSGHAQMGLLYLSSIGMIAIRRIGSRSWRTAVRTGVVTLIAVIGLSRIALGRHYATDVLAGWAAGTAYLLLLVILFTFWNRDRIQS